MKVTDNTRRALAYRREQRAMRNLGYLQHETVWEIHRGSRTDEIIIDVKVSACGKYIYAKLGKKT